MADDGDRGFCHACGGVWLLETRQDGHDNSLTCPHCESEFTEIVRGNLSLLFPSHFSSAPDVFLTAVCLLQIEIPPESPQPEREREPQSPPVNPWADHNPWAQEESARPQSFGWMESGSPGYSHRSYRSPDGRFTFSSTTIGGGYSPRQGAQPNQMLPLIVGSLDTLFQTMRATYDDDQMQRSPEMNMPPHAHAAGMREPDVMHDPFQTQDERARRPVFHEGQFPRNPNGLQQLQGFAE